MAGTGFRLMTWLAAALLALVPGIAVAANHIRATLVAESAAPAPGATTTIALAMQPDAGWHGYWQNPGDSGIETQVEWTLPRGVVAGPLRYPVPHRLLIAGLMNYVYEADYAHLISLRLPAGLTRGTVLPIRAKVKWLACTDEICVPEQADLALSLTVGSGAADPARRADFDRWRAAMPRPLGAQARFVIADGKARLAIPMPAGMDLDQPYFYPLTDGVIDYAAEQSVTRNGDALIVEAKAIGQGSPGPIEGVLRLGEGSGVAVSAVPGAVPPPGEPIAEAVAPVGGSGAATFLLALGGAILGGLLLNVMPCVFPILSLKAMGLVRRHDDRAARREAIAYTAGAMLLCALLGAGLLALRASGAAAGWAFQLQDARVILVLLLLVSAIALNLSGLFELPTVNAGGGLAAKGGAAGAFWTGALAAVIATPCTGPFMGAALGAALVLPAAAAMAVFVGLGLGLALPFLAIGFVPALRDRLPKPGPWMATFRRILAVPMFVTALGLLWILGRISGVNGMALGLGAALLLALGLWWAGLRQGRGAKLASWPAVAALAAAVTAIPLVPREAPVEQATGALGSEPFSEARLAALRGEGRPVFVYFTADWCLTCKVNERAAIDRAEVSEAFQKGGVAVLVGDWTRGDAAITRFLAGQGRSGVPLYLFYPRAGAAKTLPQVLTPGMLAALAT